MGTWLSDEAAGILALANVSHHRVEVGLRPHESHASAPRPPPSTRLLMEAFGPPRVECSTRPRLELLHHLSRRVSRRRHHGVDVLHSAVDGVRAPSPEAADCCDAVLDRNAISRRQCDTRPRQTPSDRGPQTVRRSPMEAARIGPAAFIAGKPRSVGRPCQKERDRVGSDDGSRVGLHDGSVQMCTHLCQAGIGAGFGRDRTAYAVTLPEWSGSPIA